MLPSGELAEMTSIKAGERGRNTTQTVVITTYCLEHKVPSAMIFLRHIADNYFPGIRMSILYINAVLLKKNVKKRVPCAKT